MVVTRSSNNHGPYQFPEKLIPLMVTNALEEEKQLPVYGDAQDIRDWLYVEDNCQAMPMRWRKGSQVRSTTLAVDKKRQISISSKGSSRCLANQKASSPSSKTVQATPWIPQRSRQRGVGCLLYPSRKDLSVQSTGICRMNPGGDG